MRNSGSQLHIHSSVHPFVPPPPQLLLDGGEHEEESGVALERVRPMVSRQPFGRDAPTRPFDHYVIGEAVEVWTLDGWWMGHVVEPAEPGERELFVWFRATTELMLVNEDEKGPDAKQLRWGGQGPGVAGRYAGGHLCRDWRAGAV